jgi:hypothetical protein
VYIWLSLEILLDKDFALFVNIILTMNYGFLMKSNVMPARLPTIQFPYNLSETALLAIVQRKVQPTTIRLKR